ncbi:hypothetical protein [Sediminicoccus rosea]|uniref:Flagellin n=1 Tax=Sediminicoccus rosea TaxID=1225128 RepID=A0ABZ0PBV5_9PROT|nr:hypothetical protein [Sediminicoccus rosea]WPB83094.1 hypothetical protein R9Z33_13365 [Sediminicoccus rosea]
MCVTAATALTAVSAGASVGGSVFSAQGQMRAASDAAANSFAAALTNAQMQIEAARANAAAAEEAARANAEGSIAIAGLNAEAERTAALLNVNAINETAAATMRIAESNALRFDTAAAATAAAGEAEEARRRLRSQFILADQRARYGASGVTMEGSPLEVLAFSAGQEELEALTIRHNTGMRVNDLTMQGAATRLEGSLEVQQFGTRARNLLADAVLRGETGTRAARIAGLTEIDNARTGGRARMADAYASVQGMLANASAGAAGTLAAGRASATSTLISGLTQAAQTAGSYALAEMPRGTRGSARKSFHFANSRGASSGMDV